KLASILNARFSNSAASDDVSKPDILITRQIYVPALEALEREYTVHKVWDASDRQGFIEAIGPRGRAVGTQGVGGVGARGIEARPNVEVIACFGRSLAKTDLAAAKRRGIAVVNVPDSVSVPVAEIALGLIITVMRRMVEAERYVRAGRWPENPFPPGRGL